MKEENDGLYDTMKHTLQDAVGDLGVSHYERCLTV